MTHSANNPANDPDWVYHEIRNLRLMYFMARAEAVALRALIVRERPTWRYSTTEAETEAELDRLYYQVLEGYTRHLEDSDPAMAASIQEQLDEFLRQVADKTKDENDDKDEPFDEPPSAS